MSEQNAADYPAKYELQIEKIAAELHASHPSLNDKGTLLLSMLHLTVGGTKEHLQVISIEDLVNATICFALNMLDMSAYSLSEGTDLKWRDAFAEMANAMSKGLKQRLADGSQPEGNVTTTGGNPPNKDAS